MPGCLSARRGAQQPGGGGGVHRAHGLKGGDLGADRQGASRPCEIARIDAREITISSQVIRHIVVRLETVVKKGKIIITIITITTTTTTTTIIIIIII